MISLALFALAIYLVFLIQGTHNDYSVEVLSRHGYTSSTIQARRGDIVDRNGTYVATSEPYYILVLDPKVILYQKGYNYTDKTVEALVTYFGLDEATLRQTLEDNADSSYVRYGGKTLLTYEQVSAFEEFQTVWNKGSWKNDTGEEMTKEDKLMKIKGVVFETEYQRKYPFSEVGSTVIGFTTTDGAEGLWGLESYYNDELTGTNGRSVGYLDEDYNLEKNVYPATDGNTIVSTIDMGAQTILQENIKAYMNQVGADNVGVILMNPQNGEILGMATDKEYNLNEPKDLSAYYTEEELAAMSDEEKSDAQNQIWRNWCISDSYEPGSTAKALTIATGLEENEISMDDTYYCDGYEMKGGWRINCHVREGHGLLTLSEALAESCNDSLMQIVDKIGAADFARYQRVFNLGQKTGIDLPGESSCEGLLYEESQLNVSELATNSFGQGYNVTMIQQAAAIASLINGGNYYQPHVVKEIRNAGGAVIETKNPILVRQTISSETSAEMRQMMVDVVENGTGNLARIAGYRIGGKTGAGQKLPRSSGNYVISFISFLGEDNPELLLYVVIDVPKVDDQSSSAQAQYLAKEIWSDLLPYYNEYPSDEYLKDGEEADVSTDNPFAEDSYENGIIVEDPAEIAAQEQEDANQEQQNPEEGQNAEENAGEVAADGQEAAPEENAGE
ncbi:MAG: penicillin-binding protein 2 [Cuneatibacter sp.]|nr:penicillin-binding protein 2 [Cuneatibacter sp.]